MGDGFSEAGFGSAKAVSEAADGIAQAVAINAVFCTKLRRERFDLLTSLLLKQNSSIL
jgi:hypothetical protein